MPTRPPRVLKSVGMDVIPTEPGDGPLGILTVDSDRGLVEYIVSAESAHVLRAALDQFLDYGKAVFSASGPNPQQQAKTLTVPISPTSITVGDTEIDGKKVGVLQLKSEDGREVSLVLNEGQAEFVIQAATQLQALLNPTRQ